MPSISSSYAKASEDKLAEVVLSRGLLVNKAVFVMAKTKEQKAAIVGKLEDSLKTAASAVFVHFTGITVADESAMRRSLRGDGVSYFVAKKTLIRRALESLGHLPTGQAGKHADVPLKGEVAVAWSEGNDATLAARLIHGFGKKLADPFDKLRASKLVILGGIFEGRMVGQMEMQEIATIPSIQILRGMFANIINSPIQRIAIALSEVAKTKTQ